jgi:hypothetical protein
MANSEETAVEKRRMGRPWLQPEPGQRVQLSFRITPDLKHKLDAAADHSGRSQSQECELRLEASFEADRLARLERIIVSKFGGD